MKNYSIGVVFIPLVVLILLLSINVFVFGDDALSGSNQMALLLASFCAGIIAYKHGYTWEKIISGVSESIHSAIPSVLILLLIGSLSGIWILGGIVPGIIYYGLEILKPDYFLIATCLICIVVSLSTGSSWSTVATVGIALLGIGRALGFSEGLITGAIISGAYFGDKMSPLSDTTNLAPAVAGTDLFTHIKYMSITTLPSILITMLLFIVFGFTSQSEVNTEAIESIQSAIVANFNINPLLFLVPLIVIGLIVKKVPALPAIFIGALLGGIAAFVFQIELLGRLMNTENGFLWGAYRVIIDAMTRDVAIETGNTLVNELIGISGMKGMLGTVWLIVCAMTFGGIMDHCGFLDKMGLIFHKFTKTEGSLIATTAGSCLFFNITASDQYLSIVVPGKMYKKDFKRLNLAPENLSRTLEDSGTVTSALIPWNTCGAYHSGVLGVSTMAYLPYCFFNILSPLMTLLFGYMKIKLKYLKQNSGFKETPS